eukprot:10459696-Prorocentrum_lima.AAC.1
MTLVEAEGKEPATGEMSKRICVYCELECRKKEWPYFTEQDRVNNPNYCIYEQVWKDMKCMNKGRSWEETAAYIKKAKIELNEEA